jgi:plastocyanin
MNREVRERLLLPVGIPLSATLLIGAVVLIFSRVLLAVPAEIAVAVALMAAVNILGAGAIVTWRPRMRSMDYLLLSGVAIVPIIAGIFVAAGAFEVKEGEEPRPVVQELRIAAQNLAFDLKELALKSGAPTVITFANNEALAHNLAIYNNQQDAATQQNAIFDGKTFTGPATERYRLKALTPGSFFFQCDVHPAQMAGTVKVEQAAEAPGAPAKPAELEITALGSVFDQKALTVPSGVTSTISLDNQDTLQHNISVYRSQADAQIQQNAVFKGPLFAGPATRKFRVRPPSPGTYYFQCDVHAPQMNGTLTAT